IEPVCVANLRCRYNALGSPPMVRPFRNAAVLEGHLDVLPPAVALAYVAFVDDEAYATHARRVLLTAAAEAAASKARRAGDHLLSGDAFAVSFMKWSQALPGWEERGRAALEELSLARSDPQ